MVKLKRERERERERERLKLKTGTISCSWLSAEDNDFRPHIKKIQTSTAIFASNVRLTRSTVDRVVSHTLLVYPCYVCNRHTFMHVAAMRQNRQKSKTKRTVCAAVQSYQPILISQCLREINLWGRYIH